ncbi:DinB family protein [Deinococcus pimensis]|uniref:DinB family protein n=1 Tax=Deinococcus pimensis TaxID=309888 RepID=UPI000485FA6A|nr:DinB family protein [Deinococcus pimensis]
MTHDPIRYPLGTRPTLAPHERQPDFLARAATSMEATTRAWREAVEHLPAARLGLTYRPGAFTVRELAHHTADSHLHGLIRLKHGLTLDRFTILPFSPDDWVALPTSHLPVETALRLLEAMTAHWAVLLRSVRPDDFNRLIHHPDEGAHDLWQLVAKHEWVVRHHLAHVRLALQTPAR